MPLKQRHKPLGYSSTHRWLNSHVLLNPEGCLIIFPKSGMLSRSGIWVIVIWTTPRLRHCTLQNVRVETDDLTDGRNWSELIAFFIASFPLSLSLSLSLFVRICKQIQHLGELIRSFPLAKVWRLDIGKHLASYRQTCGLEFADI